MNFKKIIALVLSVSLLSVSAAACGKADPAETQKTETSAVETAIVETAASETAVTETQASETTAIENGQIYDLQFNLSDASVEVGEEFVVTVSVSSREGVLANSIALAVLTYDSYVLELVGYENYGPIAEKHVLGGVDYAIDKAMNNIIIGLGESEVMNGTVCDIRFKVKDGAEKGTTTITFANSIAKLDSANIENGIVPAEITIQ